MNCLKSNLIWFNEVYLYNTTEAIVLAAILHSEVEQIAMIDHKMPR